MDAKEISKAVIKRLPRYYRYLGELMEEKVEVYEQLAELNREIRSERRKLALCREIRRQVSAMEEDIRKTEEQRKEAREHERRRR